VAARRDGRSRAEILAVPKQAQWTMGMK
jgi:hypothetical protein